MAIRQVGIADNPGAGGFYPHSHNFDYDGGFLFPDVRIFGAVIDGVTDDTTAILDALAALPSVYMPEGTYRTTANILVGPGKELVGPMQGAAIIRPSVAVGTALTVNSGNVKNILLDGTDTNAAIGLLIGSVLSATTKIIDVEVMNFLGAGAIGIKLRQAVETSFLRVYSHGNTKNLTLDPEAGDGTPTSLWTMDSLFREAVEEGVLILGSVLTDWWNCVFESNHKEGMKILPGAGVTAFHNILRTCWFENNWLGDGARTTKYSLTVDGNAAGASAGVHLEHVYFLGSAATEKSIDLNMVRWTSLSKVTTPSGVAGAIRVQNALSEVTFIDDAGRTAQTNLANPDGAYIYYPFQGILTPGGLLDISKPYTIMTLPVYADNAAAILGGLVAGQFYRSNGDPDAVCIVH